MENKKFAECIAILEEKAGVENQGHWKTLLSAALEVKNYFIAERCCAALGEIPRARYFRKVNKEIRALLDKGISYEVAL